MPAPVHTSPSPCSPYVRMPTRKSAYGTPGPEVSSLSADAVEPLGSSGQRRRGAAGCGRCEGRGGGGWRLGRAAAAPAITRRGGGGGRGDAVRGALSVAAAHGVEVRAELSLKGAHQRDGRSWWCSTARHHLLLRPCRTHAKLTQPSISLVLEFVRRGPQRAPAPPPSAHARSGICLD